MYQYGQLSYSFDNYDHLCSSIASMAKYTSIVSVMYNNGKYGKYGKYGQVWFNLTYYSICPVIIKCGHLLPIFDRNDKYGQVMISIWHSLTNCKYVWTSMSQYDQLWPSVANMALLQFINYGKLRHEIWQSMISNIWPNMTSYLL